MVTHVRHSGIVTDDLESSLKFYRASIFKAKLVTYSVFVKSQAQDEVLFSPYIEAS
jgi:catechol 2,3-dioxygenase-like lactoylglutathione lyase family enzyme